MDVVKFRWGDLSEHTRNSIITDAGWPRLTTFPVEQWFNPRYNTTVVPEYYKGWTKDFIISMPKDQYVEFCLTWMQ